MNLSAGMHIINIQSQFSCVTEEGVWGEGSREEECVTDAESKQWKLFSVLKSQGFFPISLLVSYCLLFLLPFF